MSWSQRGGCAGVRGEAVQQPWLPLRGASSGPGFICPGQRVSPPKVPAPTAASCLPCLCPSWEGPGPGRPRLRRRCLEGLTEVLRFPPPFLRWRTLVLLELPLQHSPCSCWDSLPARLRKGAGPDMAGHSGAFLASPWDSGLDPGGDSRWNCVGGSTGWAGDGLWAESPGRNFPCHLHARLQSCGPSPHRSAALGT